ncbi:MAG: AAA family ATPase [Deltaproteobacteria bacterium]|nr:AAA family ATPase [Deltaproteobacteria bacterium]
MATAYRSIREHLDDIVQLARLVLGRRSDGDPRETAELDLRIVDLGEIIEARMALAEKPLPLDRLRTAFQLEATEQRCLWLALAHAVSGEVRTACGNPDGLPLELLDRVVYGSPRVRDRFAAELGTQGRLLRYGLLELRDAGTGTSRLGSVVGVPDAMVELAHGVELLPEDIAGFAALVDPPADELLIEEGLVRSLTAALREHVEHQRGPIPLVKGAEGAGRRSLLARVAHDLGARALVVDCRALPADRRSLVALQREAILRRALIVLSRGELLLEPNDSAARAVDAMFRGYPGPIAITCGAHVASPLVPSRGTVLFEIPVPTEAERAQLWLRHLPITTELAAQAAARYRLTGGQIERAARVTRARADALALEDVHAGVRSALDDQLSALGSRVDWHQEWADLVLPKESLDELRELISRVRHRRKVIDDWGFGKKVAKGLGLAVLFSGPPGTGKTMAAGLIAQELGLDLYAIDLSRMVSKYIGETEKNLAQVFDAAEVGHAILLFDEADALFSKRTEVKSSVDRYANLEVNYLLQRMEAFSGITILTTNFDAAIDEAFRRRLSFRIAFPVPEEEERERLWRAVIPTAALGADIRFSDLAQKFAMSGGYIKNAALRAAYLAAADGTTIRMNHLLRAATSEYASMGKVMTQGMHGL